MCHVRWPLKALKALCHCASRKRAQHRYNNKVCNVGGRLGCCAPVWVCTLVYACTCVYLRCWRVWFCTCMWKSLHVSVSLPLLLQILHVHVFLLRRRCERVCVYLNLSEWECVSWFEMSAFNSQPLRFLFCLAVGEADRANLFAALQMEIEVSTDNKKDRRTDEANCLTQHPNKLSQSWSI